jgi:hypothetical protein
MSLRNIKKKVLRYLNLWILPKVFRRIEATHEESASHLYYFERFSL